jgi:hypothetical protein
MAAMKDDSVGIVWDNCKTEIAGKSNNEANFKYTSAVVRDYIRNGSGFTNDTNITLLDDVTV